MIMTNTETVPHMKVVELMGLARGNTIRARHLGRDILAVLRMMIGGEITDYTKMLAEAREQALDRMLAHAEQLGANAVLNVRFSTSAIMAGASELLAYGTAVRVEAED